MGKITEDMTFSGTVTIESLSLNSASLTNADINANAAISRSKLAQDTLKPYVVDLTTARVWDAITTSLPAAAANDDLGMDGGTFGTSSPHLTAGDLKAAGATTRYARFQVALPAEYDDNATVQIRIHAGMQTTVADTSCTVDVECYESNQETGISADLCATAAQSCNSLTFADLDYTITATSLVAGDMLDFRVAVTCTDGATGSVVEPTIGGVRLLCDIKG